MVLDPARAGGLLLADNEVSGHLLRASVDGAMAGGSADGVPLPFPVEDVEALAADGEAVWVLGSHSRNKAGDRKPLRERIVQLQNGGSTLWRVDWTGCAACGDPAAPNQPGAGLNVEGAAVWNAQLWLGLRAPLIDGGMAQLVELMPGVVSGVFSVRSTSIDLGGLAVRDLAVQPGNSGVLWILAGPASGKAPGAVYTLSGEGQVPTRLTLEGPADAEGLVVLPDGGIRVLTDGAAKSDGTCKEPSVLYRLALR